MTAEETVKTIQARLDVLKKSLVSEENSVQYYETLLEKTPADTQENHLGLEILQCAFHVAGAAHDDETAPGMSDM